MSYPLLILHGWGGSSKSWKLVKEILEKNNFKVYCPDLPGFGTEPDPKKAWAVSDYVEWVKDFCEKEKLSQVFLLGHSFGGRIAMKFTALYPEKLLRLILVDSAGFQHSKSWSFKQKIIIKGSKFFHFLDKFPILNIFYALLRKTVYIFSGTRDYYLIKSKVMKETFKKIITENLTRYLSEIKIPTLIVWGKKDKLVPVEIAYSLKEKIYQSQLEIFPEVRHNPHLEVPVKLAEVIINFISQRK